MPRSTQSGITSTARSLVSVARAEQLGFIAAAIAYYAFVSLVPLLLVTVAVAGIGWTLLGFLFGVYAATADSFQLYGLIGGVLLLLTWFYLGGLVLLSGATLSTVLAGRRDRQVQQGSLRDPTRVRMSESDGPDDEAGDADTDPGTGTDTAAADTGRAADRVSERVDYEDIAELRRELDRFESDIDDRTVQRDDLESDLKGYIRRRQRRGHARGWGPYLVLLYGTLMTFGAFVFLNGVWAVLAMVIVWLSTLGLYTLMVLVGVTFTVAGLPGRLRDVVRDFRD